MDWFTASSSDGRNSLPASENSHLAMSTRRAAGDAPDHHFGDEVRIGDSRSNPQAAGTTADPQKPPQAQTPPPQSLP
jgi:hypothetical protein